METLWQQQYGGYVFYISNSTVVDWTCLSVFIAPCGWLVRRHCGDCSGHSNRSPRKCSNTTIFLFGDLRKSVLLTTMTMLMPCRTRSVRSLCTCIHWVRFDVLIVTVWRLRPIPAMTPCYLVGNINVERDFLLQSQGQIFSTLKMDAVCCSKPSSNKTASLHRKS